MLKIFESEEEAKKAKAKLDEEMENCLEEVTKEFSSLKINWVDRVELKKGDETKRYSVDVWDDAKYYCNKIMPEDRIIFLAHSKDKIEGKAQLVHQTIQRIPLVRKTVKFSSNPDGTQDILKKNMFIDDSFDRRKMEEVGSLAFDFWVYRVIDKGKEHYVFSTEKFSEEHCEFKGMQINLDDISDMSSTLRVKKITSVFLAKSGTSNVKILEKDKLIEFVKEGGWDKEEFTNFLFCHPNNKVFRYSKNFDVLRIAQLLSSKYEGYPLHMFKMGPVGTGKTTEAEVLDYKFKEEQGILESANSTLKALVPSFKEKPANLGYIAKCNRIAIIDEMMKMVEQAMSKAHDQQRVSNYFGQMNMLLEHKERMVGSGNDNSTKVKATAKICVTTNNISNKSTIYEHIGLIDATTLSRYLVWVQNYEEIERIYNNEGISKYRTHHKTSANTLLPHVPPTPPTNPNKSLGVCGGLCEPLSVMFDEFLTIYDSCQKFLVDFDEDECKKIFDIIKNLAKEPMKTVWRARGLHHTILVLDGLCKFRCLFQDHDSNFTPSKEDYELTQIILIDMVKGWDTNFNRDSWKD